MLQLNIKVIILGNLLLQSERRLGQWREIQGRQEGLPKQAIPRSTKLNFLMRKFSTLQRGDLLFKVLANLSHIL